MASTPQVPYCQIRASYDDTTITVYQAYSSTIATTAVDAQKLNASPAFKPGRMTWVKPSWSWMMYRAGYSFKDPGQERILAIKMKHEHFLDVISRGVLSTHSPPGSPQSSQAKQVTKESREKPREVRIQWDPERSPKLEVLPYRSIQIGIPGSLSGTWANEWIESIEDVTEKARRLKATIDENPQITTEELIGLGLIPSERAYSLPETLRKSLRMDTAPKS